MDFIKFLSSSYTPFHTCQNCENMLLEAGFKKLTFENEWNLQKNGKYFVTKNESSIIAFKVGENYKFNIVAAHSDSPALKVKGDKLIPSPFGNRINVECYGGVVLYSFMNIPLKIAGRIFIKENGKIESKIVASDHLVSIPSLAIHLDREVNNNHTLKVQDDMLPLAGKKTSVYSFFKEKNILASDLFVVPAMQPFYSGDQNQYLAAPRLDNLASVYSMITSLINCDNSSIAIAAIFDNEEIGSLTKQGANSAFLEKVLRQINISLKYSEYQYINAIEKGFIISSDNAHATHPAYVNKSDPLSTIKLGSGIVIKHHQNYTTDGYSSAILKNLFNENNISYQEFYSNSNLPCGSTLGKFISSKLCMNTIDIGLSQLSMHCAIELCHKNDMPILEKAFLTFYQSDIDCKN